MSTQLTTRRGRRPAYDRKRALSALTDVFWQNGFDSTSLDELSVATGMARPSLYAAFGDKQAMYLAALDHVRGMLGAELVTLHTEPDLETALRGFYTRSLVMYLGGGDEPRGCLAICTAATAANTHAQIRASLADIIALIDNAFLNRIARARDQGLLLPDHDIEASATLAASVLHSLAIRARAGSRQPELQRLIEATIKVVVARPSLGEVQSGR